jgi:hypothetical protein
MKKPSLLSLAAIIATLLVFSTGARAQEHDAPKVEVGAQFSSLSLTPPGFSGTENPAGFGGRITYNLTDYFAIEAEGNIFPTRVQRQFASGGVAEQMQFGVKAGKRLRSFGVFAKARPGFVSFGDTIKLTSSLVARVPGGAPRPFTEFGSERKTHFSTDVGGVLELYPSRRLVVRFDAGDTIIRYGEHDEADFSSGVFTLDELPIIKVASETKHNFQFTAGVAYRFGGGKGTSDDDEPQSGSTERVKRFEVGMQFSSLVLRLPPQSFGPVFGPFNFGTNTEAGFGGRVGYNLNDNVALEAEGNFFPRSSFSNSTTGGYPVQMQFGVKAGKRYQRFGVFAKARPGFITFSRVATLNGTESFTFGGQTFTFGTFDDRRKTYFSMDVGGVFEFYPTRRIFTRFDLGDTMIRFGQRHSRSVLVTDPNFVIPADITHNFQFSVGIGIRF